MSLALRARAELERRRRGITSTTLAYSPLPGPQTRALESQAFETLYGGQAGGGKSVLLLILARLQARRAVLFRRSYPELEDSLISVAKEMYGDLNRYNQGRHEWTFGDQKISFRHIEDDKRVERYRSSAWDTACFDELTTFTRTQYIYLFSRVRTSIPGQRLRIVATTNPGGEGHFWVMERWGAWLDPSHPNPAQDGEIRWYRPISGKEIETGPDDPLALSRTFIRARLEDNPFISPEYLRQLEALPEPYRTQLKEGIWTTSVSGDEWRVFPAPWVALAQERWKRGSGGSDHPEYLGVDVARGGQDRTVLTALSGLRFTQEEHPGSTTPNGPEVAILCSQKSPGRIVLDVVGVGASVYDSLIRTRADVLPFIAQALPQWEGLDYEDRAKILRFADLRAAAHWHLRELLDPDSGIPLELPPDPELTSELLAIHWRPTSRGIRVESKDEINPRIGRSPDKADSLVYAAWPMGQDEGRSSSWGQALSG